MEKEKKRFVLVDANSIIHRAYHAYPSHLSNSKGIQINAVYGFSVLLLKVIEDLEPDMILCAFDVETRPTFRKKIYKEYKSTRKPVDRELVNQIPFIKKVLDAFDIPILEVEGYEADDLIGTLEADEKVKGYEKVIVTGDQDLFQLVDDDTKVFLSGRNFRDSRIFTTSDVEKKLGIKPNQVIDYKALYGDPSDNIPGVKGVGKKGAIDMLNKFTNLDGIYKNLDKIKTRYTNKLKEHKDDAFLSYKLATIKNNVDIKYDLNECKWGEVNLVKVERVFRKYEFVSLLKRIDKLSRNENITYTKEYDTEVKDEFDLVELKNIKEMKSLLKNIFEKQLVFIYLEKKGENFLNSKPHYIFLELDNTIYRISRKLIYDSDKLTKVGGILKDTLEDESIKKIGYDLKWAIHALFNIGIDLKGLSFDAKLASYILQGGNGSNSLTDIAFMHLGKALNAQLTLSDSIKGVNENARKLDIVRKLYNKFLPMLKERGDKVFDLFFKIEIPLIPVLAQMERNGILFDIDYIKDYQEKLDKKIKSVERIIFKHIGHEFNICSPKQVSEVLFDELDLPKTKRNKSGSYSTSSSQLQKLKKVNPVIEHILSYRELSKLRSTYTDTLINSVSKETGRIHTTFNQTVTTTGRLSSSDPNLQNIPISTDLGKKVRRAFIAGSDSRLLSFDIAQQELRILAHLAREDNLIEAFDKGIDIHILTASKIFNKNVSEITKKERSIGKTINYGVIYGMSERGLSQSLSISYKKAEEFIQKYFKEYAKVKKFFDNYVSETNKKGYAETLLGRRKYTGKFLNKNNNVKQSKIREVINFPIQGLAADMMKLSMIEVAEVIEKKYKSKTKMILQIHDELIFEYKGRERIEQFKDDVKKAIRGAYPLKVPLKVEATEGSNWAEIH